MPAPERGQIVLDKTDHVGDDHARPAQIQMGMVTILVHYAADDFGILVFGLDHNGVILVKGPLHSLQGCRFFRRESRLGFLLSQPVPLVQAACYRSRLLKEDQQRRRAAVRADDMILVDGAFQEFFSGEFPVDTRVLQRPYPIPVFQFRKGTLSDY